MTMDSINSRFIPSTKKKKRVSSTTFSHYYSLNIIAKTIADIRLHCVGYQKPPRDNITTQYRGMLPGSPANAIEAYIKLLQGRILKPVPIDSEGGVYKLAGCKENKKVLDGLKEKKAEIPSLRK